MQNSTNNPTDTISREDDQSLMSRVIEKISTCENILIALSRNPSVDEIAAAIGLAIYLEDAEKRVTAIYSGETPNVLEFLKPEETFETNTDSLQDFIIALDKEKADHLRYKIDGDYVKVYISPYKTKLEEDDLEFSYGDYNIDLVIALNVPTASDLDAALSEHGRIMHDASAIDVTVNEPGRFGEIEWSDTSVSSVSEMIANLLMSIKKPAVKKDVATALLTGIVAATNRFSNESTKSSTMVMASKLMDCGASEQLVAMNMMENTPVDLIGAVDINSSKDKTTTGDGVLSVKHEENDENNDEAVEPISEATETEIGNDVAVDQAVDNNANAPAVTEEVQPVVQPPELDYSKMMDEALAESLPTAENPLEMSTGNPAMAMAPEVPLAPEENHMPEMQYIPTEMPVEDNIAPAAPVNPMTLANEGIPTSEADILPPPPAPDLNFDTMSSMPPDNMSTLPEVQPMSEIPAVDASVMQQPQPIMSRPEDQPADAFQIPNV